MAERMLVTQALDERDLLVKKIKDKIRKTSFVDSCKRNEEKVVGARVSRKEFAADAESSFRQIMDLIARFERIDAAIVASNASTRVTTSYGEFTVAGAISLRSRLKGTGAFGDDADFESQLREKMSDDYIKCAASAEAKNRQLHGTAENMRLSILGKDTKVKDDKPLEVVEVYVRENTMELVDPMNVQKRTQQMKEKRDTLLAELDTQIKVSNATTFIEF